MMKERTLLLLCAVISVASAAERNYKKCDHNDANFDTCLEEAANIYLANLDEKVEGIHSTWISNDVQINSGPLQVKAQYNVTEFINSTKSVGITIKYDGPSKLLSGTIKAPHVGFRMLQNLDGTILNFRLLGIIDVILHVYDMEASYETKLHIKPRTEHKFEMEELQLNINKIRKAEITVIDIKSENKAIDAGMRVAFKQLPDLLFNLAKAEWSDPIRVHYEEIMREALKEMLEDGLVEE